MDVDQIICKSLEYSKSSWSKVATLGVIIIVPFLILTFLIFLGVLTSNFTVMVLMAILGIVIALIAGIFIYGYLLRVIKATIVGDEDLPSFDGFGDMMVGGLKVFVVNIVYGIIFGIVAAIPIGILMILLGLIGGVFGVFSSVTTMTDPSAALGTGLIVWIMYLALFIIYLIVISLGVLYLIVVPMGIANMARTGDIGSAFAFSELRQKIESIRWGKVIVWVIANQFVFTIAVLISYILGLLLIGIIIVPLIIIPFMAIYYARTIGLIYRNDT